MLSSFRIDIAHTSLRTWESLTGEQYNPWAEAVMLLDAIGWLDPSAREERHDLENLLARRLSELGR